MQFIATTHSPQIISEIQRENLIFLDTSQEYGLAYGLDSNWILEHVMHTPSRPKITQEKIEKIEDALYDGDFKEARRQLQALRALLNGDDGEVVRLEASINTFEDLAE